MLNSMRHKTLRDQIELNQFVGDKLAEQQNSPVT